MRAFQALISAFEQRVEHLENEKLLLMEKIAQTGKPKSSFDETVRTALAFLANPWNLWASGQLESRRQVLKLAFVDRLRYSRENGFRTANLALPFKVLGAFDGCDGKMARSGRFERLPTPRFVVWCSIQLSYERFSGGIECARSGSGDWCRRAVTSYLAIHVANCKRV